ncbi:MAG TPA: helix-turn-helix transcriptional regulator [Actinomycetota bacterium]
MVARYVQRSAAGSGALRDPEVPAPLYHLLTLSSSLAIRWTQLDDQSRLALIRQLQSLTTELGLRTRVNTLAQTTTRQDGTVSEGLMRLTPRELDVLGALAEGHSTGHVATLLEISASTVRSHVKSLLPKLGVHSRLEAVALLLKQDPNVSLRSA